MVPTSQKEINQREKDLYYTVLSFLKKIRREDENAEPGETKAADGEGGRR